MECRERRDNMIGYCTLTPERRKGKLERMELCGLPLCGLRVAEGRWEERRLRRGAKRLAQARVRWVLTPEDFPYWETLGSWGLEPPDPSPLLRRLGYGLALAWLRRREIPPERAVVALRGRRGAELAPTAEALCPCVGALVLDAPGGEGLSNRLRANYGMAPLGEGAAGRMDLALHFAPELPNRGEPVLELWPGAPLFPGLTLSIPELPGGTVCAPMPLLAALWETGRLRAERVAIDFA